MGKSLLWHDVIIFEDFWNAEKNLVKENCDLKTISTLF